MRYGTVDPNLDTTYYESLLAEKDKQIQTLKSQLSQSQRKNERVARKILDNPTITHSAKRSKEHSDYSRSRSPFRDDQSNGETTSPIRLHNIDDSHLGEQYIE